MGGYLILIIFGVAFGALVIHVLRAPRMPDRRPFGSEENGMIGEPKSTFSARDPGAGRGGDGMI
jgi:hypothetical protein